MNKLTCLSIREPWASLIIDGGKSVEIRYWRPGRAPKKLLGQRIGIHASQTYAAWAHDYLERVQVPHVQARAYQVGVIGTAVLKRIKVYTNAAAFERDWNAHLNPQFLNDPERECLGLVFAEPVRFAEPIVVKGQLGFFRVNLGGLEGPQTPTISGPRGAVETDGLELGRMQIAGVRG